MKKEVESIKTEVEVMQTEGIDKITPLLIGTVWAFVILLMKQNKQVKLVYYTLLLASGKTVHLEERGAN